MSCNLTQSFTLDCNDNVGGIKEIKLKAFDSTLTGITVVSGVATLAGVGLTGWRKYVCPEETAKFDDNGKTDRQQGTRFYSQVITYINNKLRAAFRNELDVLHQSTVWVLVTDNNDAVWLFGYERGMFLETSTSASGTAFGDRSGYTLTLSGKERQPMVSVSNAWNTITS